MLGNVIIKRGRKDEGEKPFWISYADLMTALMVLFLVTMAAALLTIAPKIEKVEEVEKVDRRKEQYDKEIRELLNQVEAAAKEFPTIRVDKEQKRIDFKKQVNFALDSAVVHPGAAKTLRAFVPRILAVARSPLGEKWMKQIVVEGYASPEGGYFYNMRLSMDRSRAVLCALFARPGPEEIPLTEADLFLIQDLFLIGGYSYNSLKPNPEESRRVEMRLDFLEMDENRTAAPVRSRSQLDRCQ